MSPVIDSLAEGSSRQRDTLNHQAIEDYLKTIYKLEQRESPVTTSRVAEARLVKPGSATNMIQRLHRLKLVEYEKHYGATLTDAGKKIALEVIRHHRLIELYLIEALGFSWDEVHEEADILEHVISDQLEERIAAALEHPEFDPHGAPIPTKEGAVIEVESVPLTALKTGTSAVVSRIREDENSEKLRYLANMNMVPGAVLTVLEVAPFDGPITVLIEKKKQVVGFKLASSIMVSQQQT